MILPKDLFHRFESIAGTQRILVRDLAAGKAYSGLSLLDQTHFAARQLRKEGISPGDLVLLEGLSGTSFITGLLAVWACDAAALAADPELAPREVDALFDAFSPRMVLRGEGGAQGAGRAGSPLRVPLPAGTAVVKITSGSTGSPRGIAVSAHQLMADTAQILEGMGIGPEDLNIAVIPLSHSYGMDSLVLPLVAQGNPVLLAAPFPELLARALSTEEPAVFPGIPTLFDFLGRPAGPFPAPRGLKLCISAGALLRSATARTFRERFGLPVRVFYGCSETGGITYDASPGGRVAEESEGCVGTPLPGVKIRLEGEEGRVVVGGENVASGYVGSAGDSADGEFSGGCFSTGDTGRMDETGRLHLTGRISGLVNVSGRKVNPREIEEILLVMGEVTDAAALGVPDELRGESLLACVVASRDLTRERVMSHLRERLAPYKLPRRVLFLKEIPRSARGKLDRREILRLSGVERESEPGADPDESASFRGPGFPQDH